MSTIADLLSRQRIWASRRGWAVDESGYVADIHHNLSRALSALTEQSFRKGGGSELSGRAGRQPKMHALHSSAALAVNVFDYWTDLALEPLLNALGLPGRATTVEFESQFPTGLGGTPPNLDVTLLFDDTSIFGIESKYSEWLTPQPRGKEAFQVSYFSSVPGRWNSLGLTQCEALARAMHARSKHFRFLHAAQLLKHALGLASWKALHGGPRFTLYYLFYEADGPESTVHRQEIERFEAQVAGLVLSVALALFIAYHRGGAVDRLARAFFIAGMSVSALVYVLVMQYGLAFMLGWFPISGL